MTGTANSSCVNPIPAGFFAGSSPGIVSPIMGPIATPKSTRQKTIDA